MGGGASGKIEYGQPMQDEIKMFFGYDSSHVINNDITELINIAHTDAGNPYVGVETYDPSDNLTELGSQFDASKAIIDALDPDTIYGTFIDAAYNKYSKFDSITFLTGLNTAITGLLSAVESAMGSSSLTNLVTAFENNKRTRFLRDVSTWTAGMADVNAVHTSSFVIGLSLLQDEFAKSVDEFEKTLKADLYGKIVVSGIDSYLRANVLRVQNKDAFLIQSTEFMTRLEQLRQDLQIRLTQVKAEVERLSIIAQTEEANKNIDISAEEALWDFEVFMYAGNLLSSGTGSTAGRKSPKISDGQSALGGAASGAAIGTQINAGWGTAIGAVVGAALGWALNQ